MSQSPTFQSGIWPSPRFPPAPPSSPPPTLAYPYPSRPSTPPCPPTLPCPPTQVASPSTPSIPSSQPRQAGTPYVNSPGGQTTADDSRTYSFDPNPHWQEDKDHYDNQKINGLTFPRCIRQSAFTQKLDIEGCDPLKLPVAALLYQQANNFWLRKLAHGREVYLIPTGDIAAVVFTTELLTQLRNKGVDMDKVASCKARQDGKLLDKTNNTKYAAQQVADLIHSWVPTRAADPDTQHELTQLRSQLAQLRQQLGDTPGDPSSPNTTGPSASSPPPIHAALLRSSQSPAPPAPPGFDPSSLLVASTTVNPWIAQNKPTSLAVRAFNKWLKELPISEPKRKVLNDNFAKMEEWWAKQPAEALDTIERVAATMGIPVNLMGKNYEALNLLRTMTAGISLTNWLAPLLRRKLKHKVLQSHLQILQSMILIIYILTPFTMTHSIHLFQGFRIIQTRMMVLTILHGLRPNPKLKSILEGCADLQHLWGTTLHSHNLFSRQFFQPQSVYIRFTHIQNMQPKFYLGSAMHHTLDREYSRSRKYFQLTHERLVQAELALRYWHEHDNLYIWAPIPIYTDRVDYRSLEVALIQEWQPRLNYPFICQFYHPKKGLLKKPLLNTNAQFGLATLWRRAKHKFTPQLVRQVLTSSRFQNRLELWTIVHALGSNTKARFEQTKMLRSNDGGLLLCYALRRLANNTQEPFRTLSLTAIDATIKWWHGKPAPRASALRAPWSLSPNLQSQLKKFLRQWHFQMLDHQVPCHTPSFKTVFIKHSAVLDILCNHKQAIEDWSTSNPAICCCKSWSGYKTAALNLSDPHWVLSGSLLHSLLPPELAVIAEGSLLNKVFPSKKEYFNQMRLAIKTWTKKNGLPSMPQASISDLCHHLWSEHTQQVTNHITKSSINQLQSTFEGAIFHCEDKHASSLRIYCPCLYYQSIASTFQDLSIFEPLPDEPSSIVTSLVESLHRQHGKAYPWAVGSGRQLPAGYILAKRKKNFQSGRPIISFVESPFRPMLNILARLIFQLIPSACPDHFATGDVYTLLSILREAPVDADLILVNQDLAGFFTSIDQERFIRSWFMLLDFLRPKMNVCDDEVFSVYPGKSNNPGDIIKGRTFRRLNVTRKIVIKHVPDLIKSALDMQTFALGQRCVRQCRGSPMGSPLSPALCLMVVSISEQIWSNTFRHLMSNHHLFIRHIRYVDNRLIFGDKRLTELAPYEVLLDEGFYGKPIILETEPDQEFLGFMLETKPLELIYQGPTNISQVLTLFRFTSCCSSEWLPLTLSHCHQGCVSSLSCSTRFDPVNSFVFPRWVSQGGTPDNFRPTLDSASELPSQCQTRAFCLHTHVLSCFPVLFCFSFSVSFLGYALGSFSCVAVFPCALFGSFLAQSSLALSFLLCIPDGSRPSSRFPSPPGSGSDAFELFGGAPSLFRALHWMGGLFASSNSSSWQHEITKLAHLRSFTSIVSATNIGYTWRDPVPHGGKSWTKPSFHHLSSSNSHGKGPSIHKSSRCSHSSSHVGSKSKSRPSGQHSIWTWSFPEHDSGSSPLQAKGIIHHWPTTKEATKSIQPSGYRSIQGTRYFSSRSASDFLRCSYQCPQFWRLWWWWRINSGLRSRPWPSLCSSWRVYISRYHSSG